MAPAAANSLARFTQNAAPSINAKGQADAGAGSVLRSAMFSTRLERRRQFNRLAVLVAATLLVVGIALAPDPPPPPRAC